MNKEWLDQVLGYLEVSEKRRQKIEAQVHRIAEERGDLTQSELYDRVVGIVEAYDVPYRERFALRLDESPSGYRRPRYEFVHGFDEQKEDAICLHEVPRSHLEFVEEARELLGDFDLETLIQTDIASVDDVAARIKALRDRQETHLYVVPPGKPLKRVYFDGDNKLHIQLGCYPRNFDPVLNYNEFYDGVPQNKLQKINQGLYQQLYRRDKLKIAPKIRNDFDGDPVAYYHKHHAGDTRGELIHKNHSLYERLKRDGKLDIVPKLTSKQRRIIAQRAANSRFWG